MFPDMELSVPPSVPVNPVQVKDAQTQPEIPIDPAPLEPLIMTSSPDVGADAPEAPPLDALQCEVSLESHVPVPPTQ